MKLSIPFKTASTSTESLHSERGPHLRTERRHPHRKFHACTLGWFIFQHLFLFFMVAHFSHAFNYAEFNGTNNFEIKKIFRCREKSTNIGCFIKMTKKGPKILPEFKIFNTNFCVIGTSMEDVCAEFQVDCFENRSSVGRASDSQPAPGSSPCSRRFGARYI